MQLKLDKMLQQLISSVSSSQADPNVERFNILLIEFFTKLKRVGKFGPNSLSRMDKILALAKADSPLPLNIFKSVTTKEDIRKLVVTKNVNIFDKLPLVDGDDFIKLSKKTQANAWKYVTKLMKIADAAEVAAVDLNNLSEMATTAFNNLDLETVGEVAWGILGSVKKIFRRNDVEEDRFLKITEEIVEALPNVGDLEPKMYAGKARKFVGELLFSEDDENKKVKKKLVS